MQINFEVVKLRKEYKSKYMFHIILWKVEPFNLFYLII
jgi:hypothetical protein